MAANVSPPASGINGGVVRSPRWGLGKDDPVARYLAPRLRLAPKTVQHLLRGPQAVNDRCAEIIRAFQALGDAARLERFWRVIRSAYEEHPFELPTAPLWQSAQDADAGEDADEMRFQLDPSDANLDRLIRSKDREIVQEIALRDALILEQRRRRGLA